MKKMRRILCFLMALCLLLPCALAEPPAKPDGQPPEMPGNPPDGMGGPGMGNPPGGMGGPGGGSSKPESYDAVLSYDSDAVLSGETVSSAGTDENAILVTNGKVTVSDSAIVRESGDSTGGDSASFYGVGAAVLATGGTVTIEDSEIRTDAKGGAGVFSYGDGVAVV